MPVIAVEGETSFHCPNCFLWVGPETIDINDQGRDLIDTDEKIKCSECGNVLKFKKSGLNYRLMVD